MEFRYDDSFVRVCGACRSAVLRTDRGIETLGKLADLVPTSSPLRLFADGRFGSLSFILVGMAQLRHGAGGLWQEWYAKLDGGRWAWLSEAQGRFYLTFEKPDVAVPAFEQLSPGAQVTIDGRTFTVAEVGTASYASAVGEIPYRLDPAATFRFADLADGQGGFATIDFGDPGDAPTVYVGHQVTLAELGISGGEAASTAAAKQGAALPCPNCGGSLELRAPDQTLRVGCPYCNHLVSVQTGNLAVIGKLARKASPRVPLGAKGKFVDGELTVIGYMQRSAYVDGSWWPFEEYLLYAPEVGFRWLVLSDGHWSYVQPIAPGAVELMPVRYDGVEFELYARAHTRVDEVLGEFYWQVQVGERAVAVDYIAPPAMLSKEETKTEETWSLATYMTADAVKAAFGATAVHSPAPVGVGPNQPYAVHGIGWVGAALMTALFGVGLIRCASADNKRVHTHTFEIPGKKTNITGQPLAEADSAVTFSEPFRLEAGRNIEIQLTASLSNNWAYLAVDLVNENTGALVSFDRNLEYYSGFEGGERWSEGSNPASQVLAPMEAGSYVIRVEGTQGGATPIVAEAHVLQDVFRVRWFVIALLLVGIPLAVLAIHAYSFKKRRWANSSIEMVPIGDDNDD